MKTLLLGGVIAYWCSMCYITLYRMSCHFTVDAACWNDMFVLVPVVGNSRAVSVSPFPGNVFVSINVYCVLT